MIRINLKYITRPSESKKKQCGFGIFECNRNTYRWQHLEEELFVMEVEKKQCKFEYSILLTKYDI